MTPHTPLLDQTISIKWALDSGGATSPHSHSHSLQCNQPICGVMLKATLMLLSLAMGGLQAAYPNVYRPIKTAPSLSEDVGDPLILTPYLEVGRLEEARAAALVTIEEFASVPSFSGFFTVDPAFDSHLFFWFVPSQGDYATDPVLLWLQGGPGASSLYGLFSENGPFMVSSETGAGLRASSWTRAHSMLYIDNPAGTGFSYTEGGFARNETKVGEDLYSALVQFFTLFPELQANAFFVSGESYAGKYVPAVGRAVHLNNPTAALRINLQGLLIGDGLSDPENMISQYGEYLYQIGLVDESVKNQFVEQQELAVQYIREERFLDAFLVFDLLLNGDFTSPTLFQNATGPLSYFNYLDDMAEDDAYEEFVQEASVRRAIHVGALEYSSDGVEEALREDVMQSVAPWIADLLSHYRMLFFNGQLDIIVAYPLTVNFLQRLQFDGADEYRAAERTRWTVGRNVAGYVKTAGNLTEVLVRNAGHMVPADQPDCAYDLVYRFVRGIALN